MRFAVLPAALALAACGQSPAPKAAQTQAPPRPKTFEAPKGESDPIAAVIRLGPADGSVTLACRAGDGRLAVRAVDPSGPGARSATAALVLGEASFAADASVSDRVLRFETPITAHLVAALKGASQAAIRTDRASAAVDEPSPGALGRFADACEAALEDARRKAAAG